MGSFVLDEERVTGMGDDVRPRHRNLRGQGRRDREGPVPEVGAGDGALPDQVASIPCTGVRVPEGAGDGSGPATGVKPGALTALLQEVAATSRAARGRTGIAPARNGHRAVRDHARTGARRLRCRLRGQGPGPRPAGGGEGRPAGTHRRGGRQGSPARPRQSPASLHPNLITLFDVGTQRRRAISSSSSCSAGRRSISRIEEGPLPVQEAVHIATEVARGLAHAHAEGVIHRDLKPANVFVTNKGQVKILDFGMAHAFGRRRLSGGTPAYMAPEQWEDAPEDERTDVFALGVMLYRMLTGEYPFPEGQGRWSAEPATRAEARRAGSARTRRAGREDARPGPQPRTTPRRRGGAGGAHAHRGQAPGEACGRLASGPREAAEGDLRRPARGAQATPRLPGDDRLRRLRLRRAPGHRADHARRGPAELGAQGRARRAWSWASRSR